MASLLEQVQQQVAARQGLRRAGGVTTYTPQRGPQQFARPVAQRQATPRQRRGGGSQLDQLLTAFSSTPEAQDQAQKEAEAEAKANQGFWGKGLGIVLGNPLSKAVFGGLEYLSYPRRAIQVGLEELTKLTPEWMEMGANRLIDEDRNDGRSAWDRISDPTYGFGSMTGDATGNKWANRAIGFGGDLLLDPLTYVTGGATKAAKAPEALSAADAALDAAAAARRAQRVVDVATKTANEAGTLARPGMVDDYLEALQGVNTANETWRQADEVARELLAQPGRVVPARANRAGRMGELGELAIRQPDVAQQHAEELQRIIQRGYSAAETPELRQAMGLLDPQLRFAGAPIPGTKTIARGLENAGGAIRGGLNRVPRLAGISRGPMGLEGETARLLGREGGQEADQVFRDLTKIGMANVTREGAEVQLRGNRLLTRLTRTSLGKMSPADRALAVEAAETAGEATPLNDFFNRIADIYEGVAGRKVYRLDGNGDNYVPHMLTPRFRRYLADGDKEVSRALGFTTDDLLEGSGYIEKARKLVPGAKIKIGGQEFTVQSGTIAGLNNELREVFPSFQGKFFEDDPIRIGESYIDSLAKGAGKERALQVTARSQNPLVRTVTDELEEERQAFNAAAEGQDDLYQALRSGTWNPEEVIRPDVAPIPESDFFTTTPNRAATQARDKFLTGKGARQVRMEARTERNDIMKELVDDVVAKRNGLADAIRAERDRITPELPSSYYKKQIAKLEKQLAGLEEKMLANPVGFPQGREELADFMVTTRLEIEKLERQRPAAKGLVTKRGKKALEGRLAEIDANLVRLQELENSAIGMVADPQPLVDAVEARLQDLNRGVRQAEEALQAAIDAYPPRYKPGVVAQAQLILQRHADGATYGDSVLQRARTVVEEENKWLAARDRATKDLRRKVTMQEFFKSKRRSRGPIIVEGRHFQESDLEVQTIDRVRRESQDKASRQRFVSSARLTRERYEQTLLHRKDEARQMAADAVQQAKVDVEARFDEAIQNITRRQRVVLTDARKRIRLLDEHEQTLRLAIQHDRQAMVAVRAQEEAIKTYAKQVEKLSTDVSKVRKIDEITRLAIDPMEKIAAANPNLDDEVLNSIEVMLSDAADRMIDITKRDLTDDQVAKLIKQAEQGKLAPVMMAMLNDQWKLMHPGVVGEGSIIVDSKLADQFNLLYELKREPGLFGRTLNSLTNLFKTYATLSPGFHVRNGLSAIFMNLSDGVGLRTQNEAVGLWRAFQEGGDEWLMQQSREVRDAFTAIAATGAGGRFTEAGVAEMISPDQFGGSLYNRLASNRVTRASQRAGNAVEGAVRLGMALDSMYKGESLQSAIQRITRIHFDYGQVSRLDDQAKRLIPFWTFMSRNLPLQVSQMWTKPRAYAIYNNFVRNFASADEPYTPDYWSDAGAWNSGAKVRGMPLYIQPDLGFTRLQDDVSNIEEALSGENPGALLSNFNPLLTAPLEYVTRTDFFTGQQFPEGEGFERQGGILGTPLTALAAVLGQTDGQGGVDPRFMNALNAVNPLQGRAERLAPQLTGGDDEAKRRQMESIARFLGLPVRTLTQKQQDNEYLRRYYDQLEELQRQRAAAAS